MWWRNLAPLRPPGADDKPLKDEQVLGQGIEGLALCVLKSNLTCVPCGGYAFGCLREACHYSIQNIRRAHPRGQGHRKHRKPKWPHVNGHNRSLWGQISTGDHNLRFWEALQAGHQNLHTSWCMIALLRGIPCKIEQWPLCRPTDVKRQVASHHNGKGDRAQAARVKLCKKAQLRCRYFWNRPPGEDWPARG